MADWRDEYQKKLMTANQAAQLIRSGDSIFAGGASAIPVEFSDALAERSADLQNVDFYAALDSEIEYVATEYGCVNLRYLSNVDRIEALIGIAHPDFSEQLRAGVLAEGVVL